VRKDDASRLMAAAETALSETLILLERDAT
jgi:hypothetical protein